MEATNYTTNSDMLTLLASRVKEYRLAARMSQKELAEQSGVSQTTISHFEQGVSRNLTLANFISLFACARSGRAARRDSAGTSHAADGASGNRETDT
ncbi:helix-turn-helix domain-containing protein [Phocaeicola vulgatus]|nr:helix-turn-helix domain-containing protein [Phocaeicola vulgatus]